MMGMVFFFFFQAEDGIRDFHVTGVQTCALPISYVQLALVQVDVGGESAEDEGRCEDQCDESASHVHPPDVRLHRSALRLVERPSKRGRRESFMALGRFSGAMRMPRAARAYDAGYIAIY